MRFTYIYSTLRNVIYNKMRVVVLSNLCCVHFILTKIEVKSSKNTHKCQNSAIIFNFFVYIF